MIKLNKIEDREICIIGLGFVGLTLAISLAEVGFKIQGVEVNEKIINGLKLGTAHFYEPGMDLKLKNVIEKGYLLLSSTIPREYRGTVFIITVGTPLSVDGSPRMDMIESVSKQVASVLKKDDLIIMRSTVKVGVTDGVVSEILNGTELQYEIAYCPERTLEGNALEELRSLPQIIGAATEAALMRAAKIFQRLTPVVLKVANTKTAEMIKLVDNSYRDLQFAYANEIAIACEKIGISANEVINAGKLAYPRTNLPKPGLVGGPCLEKDPHILVESVKSFGVDMSLTRSARETNEGLPGEIVRFIKNFTLQVDGFNKKPRINLMGLAFKGSPITDDIRGTMAKPILDQLWKYFPDAEFSGFDYIVSEADITSLGLTFLESEKLAFRNADIVIILNNHKQFSLMPLESLSGTMNKPSIIYDVWNSFNNQPLVLAEGVSYKSLGNVIV
jgi:UDP-N-acetyl-D-mannosaminuronic acid dehydrogenase